MDPSFCSILLQFSKLAFFFFWWVAFYNVIDLIGKGVSKWASSGWRETVVSDVQISFDFILIQMSGDIFWSQIYAIAILQSEYYNREMRTPLHPQYNVQITLLHWKYMQDITLKGGKHRPLMCLNIFWSELNNIKNALRCFLNSINGVIYLFWDMNREFIFNLFTGKQYWNLYCLLSVSVQV